MCCHYPNKLPISLWIHVSCNPTLAFVLHLEQIDVYHLPSGRRVHEAIGRSLTPKKPPFSYTSKPGSSSSSGARKATVEEAGEEEEEETIGSSRAKAAAEEEAQGKGEVKTGIVMSMKLFQTKSNGSKGDRSRRLHLVAGYEDGSVSLLSFSEKFDPREILQGKEGKWERIWTGREHKEPGEFDFAPS